MSGDANLDDVIDALRIGAVDFLKKPWSTSELASALERGIEVFRTLPQPPPARVSDAGRVDRARARALAHAAPRQRARKAAAAPAIAGAARRQVSGAPPSATCTVRRATSTPPTTRAPRPADEIVHLLEGDPGLATAVLRLANSRLYPGQEETQYLTTAVARVGARMVHAVAETLALRDGYPIRATELRTLHERIWRFSVARGLAMRAIAEVTGPEVALEPDRCYLGGLLLDAGAAFLLWTLDESRREPFPRRNAVRRAAAQVLSSYHPAFGQAVLSRWGMSGRSGRAGARSPRAGAAGARRRPCGRRRCWRGRWRRGWSASTTRRLRHSRGPSCSIDAPTSWASARPCCGACR